MVRRILLLLLVFWVLLLTARCHLPEPLVRAVEVDAAPVDSSTVYLIQHGWHAGIALERAHLRDGALPAFPGVPESRYLEVGWGEGHYYPNPEPGVWTFARAGLWPTASVVHVVPIDRPVAERFPTQRILRLRLDAAALHRLAAYIRASVSVEADSDSTPPAQGAAPGYYRGSRFFASPLRYHAFQNCNHWIAEALESAGCETARWRALTVGAVFSQAARCGTVVRP